MQDILFDNDNELAIVNGDFKIGFSDDQHKKHLLLFEKGSLKQHPTACVGAYRYLEAENRATFLREVAIQFSGDGMKLQSINVDDQGKLNINANY